MLFGRDMPGKEGRVEWGRRFVEQRSPWALGAGALGIAAPIDGIILVPLAVAAIVIAIVGWVDLNRRPHLLGRGLCLLGFVGGAIGVGLFVALRWWVTPGSL